MSATYIRFEKKRIIENYLQVKDVICDRCGKPANIVGGRSDMICWGRFEGQLQGTGNDAVADLCMRCTIKVKDFIDGDKGKGCQIGYKEPVIVEKVN